jgi:DNA-binding NarL/FixJ family response regulator
MMRYGGGGHSVDSNLATSLDDATSSGGVPVGSHRVDGASDGAEPPPYLSPGELRLLRHVAEGLTVSAAAYEVNITPATAKHVMHMVRQRLGVHSTIEALLVMGWLKVPE